MTETKEHLIKHLEGIIERVSGMNVSEANIFHEDILSEPIWREGRNAPPEQHIIGFIVKISVSGVNKK